MAKIQGLRQIMRFDNRWQLILSRALFGEALNFYRLGEVVFVEDHAAGDANGARYVLTEPMYRQFLRRLDLPQNVRLLDLGSSNGGFPLLLKHMGVTIASIAAVEMHPRTFRRMRFNIELNFDCELRLLNAAVGGREGTVEVNLSPGSTGESLYKPANGGVRASLPLVTLNTLLARSPADLVKMDIEGAEFEIFASHTWTALEAVRYLIIEIHPQYGDPRDVIRRLGEAGFEPVSPACDDVHCFVNRNAEA
jgi:FkbM family methyltransferase